MVKLILYLLGFSAEISMGIPTENPAIAENRPYLSDPCRSYTKDRLSSFYWTIIWIRRAVLLGCDLLTLFLNPIQRKPEITMSRIKDKLATRKLIRVRATILDGK